MVGLHMERSEQRHPGVVGHPVEICSHPKMRENDIVGPPCRGELVR
jgi:hypothetical protein